MTKLLSINVALYNLEDFAEAFLDSLVHSAKPFGDRVEIILVDDGSRDHTGRIVDQYRERYPELVTAYHKQNGGLSDARNFAIERASGEYLWMIDGDDLVPPAAVKSILAAIDSVPADYHVFSAAMIDESGQVVGSFAADPVGHVDGARLRFDFDQFTRCFYNRNMTWLKVYRRCFIGDLRFLVGYVHQDVHFDFNVLLQEPRACFHDDVIYHHYYGNPTSTTNTMSVDRHLQVLRLYRLLWEQSFALDEDHRGLELRRIISRAVVNRAMYVSRTMTVKESRVIVSECGHLLRGLATDPGVRRHTPGVLSRAGRAFYRLMMVAWLEEPAIRLARIC